jgi:hypothetical protein
MMLRYQGAVESISTSPSQPTLLQLPNTLAARGYKAKCVRDSQCSGPPNWSPPVAGTCSNGRCVCPLPWTGHSCHRELQCHLYAEGLGWDTAACSLDASLTVGGRYGCRCNRTGSFDLMVVEQSLSPMRPKPLVGIQPINLAADLAYLADMWKHPLAPIVIFSIDLIWILLVIVAICRSNESDLRKNARFHDFWRAQHKERVKEEMQNRVQLVGWRAKTKAWLKKTGNQIKAQHKLIRTFFVKFDVGEDPANKPTGAQKATVIMSIIMFRMMVSALFCNPAAKESYEKQTMAEAMLTRFFNGMLTAVLTIPATVFLDRMFMKAQRVTNAREKKNGEVRLRTAPMRARCIPSPRTS